MLKQVIDLGSIAAGIKSAKIYKGAGSLAESAAKVANVYESGRSRLNAGAGMMSAPSLSQYTKPATLMNRAYIDGNLTHEPITSDVLKTLHNLYTALIITALQISQYIDGTHTVKELMKVVSTESFEPLAQEFAKFCNAYPDDKEAKWEYEKNKDDRENKKEEREASKYNYEHGEPEKPGVQRMKDNLDLAKKRNELKDDMRKDDKAQLLKGGKNELRGKTKDGKPNEAYGSSITATAIDLGDNILPIGKYQEISFANPNDRNNVVKINILIQVLPFIINPEIVVDFIKLDARLSFSSRLLQWRAGEISFWKDIVLQLDIAKQRRKTMKKDKDGIIAAYTSEQTTKTLDAIASNTKALDNALNEKKWNVRQNIANSFLIFDARTVLQAKAETGFDILRNKDHRNSYFNRTKAMIICIIDTMTNEVDLFINGYEHGGTYTFDQFKIKTKGGSDMELMKIIQSLASNKMPTMRY